MALRKFVGAATSGDLEAVKSLLISDDHRELLDGAANEGNTALICASASGREKVVRYLLEKGAKLDVCNDYGWTALMAASYWGHESIVSILLQYNFKLANSMNRYDCMPLSGAARRNHIHVAELLISKGAAVNVNEDTGHTPLMTAVQHGHDLMVELLITKGANVNCKDPLTGWTPLMLAALNGHTTAAQILIKNGANCNEVNILDKTAFEIAKKRKRKDVENVLERVTTLGIRDAGNLGVDINIVGAARQGNLERLQQLSTMSDFNVNETTEDGVSPLMCAAALNHLQVVQFLIDNKADINLQDKTKGWTALIHALNYSHKSIICLLILSGADVQLKALSGHTSFDFAIYNGQTEIFRILVAGGSMANSVSKQSFVKKMYKEALLADKKSASIKHNSNDLQAVSEIHTDTSKQGIKMRVSKGLNKLWNFNRTVRGLNKKQTPKARTFQPSLNDLSGRYQINVDSVKHCNILSENITSGERLSTDSAALKSGLFEGNDQKKTIHLPLAGPSTNLWTKDFSEPVVPTFTPTTVLDFTTVQRDSVQALSVSPQDSGFYSFHSKHNGQMSPVNNLLNQGEQSPECSFSFSMAGNSPNSSFTGSTNARDIPSKKQCWSPVNMNSQSYQNHRQLQLNSTSCSPPSTTSTSPTHHYLVPTTSKTSKRKSNSLPRIGQSSVAPLHSSRRSAKSEPDDEEIKQLLAKLSLEKYSPIFEEHEVDIESFVTLDEADLNEIGIDQDEAKEQILAAVQQLRKQKEKKRLVFQTEAWS